MSNRMFHTDLPGASSSVGGHDRADQRRGQVPAESPTPALQRVAVPGYQRLTKLVVAVAIVGGPLSYLVGGLLEPAAHLNGQATIAANAAASPVANAVHMIAFVVASYLLPIGVVGLAYLAWHHSPWLATIGGLLGVLGWLPFSALAALDDLAIAMAHLPSNGSYAALWDRFAYDPVMNGYLLAYIIGHLTAYVLLGIALRRARVIPAWAAGAMVASSPLLIAAFALPQTLGATGLAVAGASVALLIIGSLPAAACLLRPAVR